MTAPGLAAPGSAALAGSAGRRGRGRQVAKIGVPAAVIVTVGAGALMMLTGRANDMLAERASSGALSAGPPSASAVPSVQAASLSLAGYPGGHGTVGVAALWSAGGTTMAVGYADAHPAVWRHATDGTWSLVSAAALGGLTGHLTSVSEGPSGWIAVGSANENGTVEPVVFWSPDGVSWTPQPALTDLAGSGAQFLGVAAGPGGYLVVGKDGGGNQARAALWWSADLKNWTSATSGGAGSFAAAAVAVGNGFVAVGLGEQLPHDLDLAGRQELDRARPRQAVRGDHRGPQFRRGQPGRPLRGGGLRHHRRRRPPYRGDLRRRRRARDPGRPQRPAGPRPPSPRSRPRATASSPSASRARPTPSTPWSGPQRTASPGPPPAQVTAAGSSQITALTDTGTMVTGTAQRGPTPSVLNLPAR